ncbi:MAG: hypothetical protein ACKVPX_11980 [Myxococcaceae bacterium]
MKDYLQIDVSSTLGEDEIFKAATQHLPAFSWRRGESDTQGPYASGTTADSVHLKMWFEEKSCLMSVSFRRAWPNDPDREEKKQEIMTTITKGFIPTIGYVSKIDS